MSIGVREKVDGYIMSATRGSFPTMLIYFIVVLKVFLFVGINYFLVFFLGYSSGNNSSITEKNAIA